MGSGKNCKANIFSGPQSKLGFLKIKFQDFWSRNPNFDWGSEKIIALQFFPDPNQNQDFWIKNLGIWIQNNPPWKLSFSISLWGRKKQKVSKSPPLNLSPYRFDGGWITKNDNNAPLEIFKKNNNDKKWQQMIKIPINIYPVCSEQHMYVPVLLMVHDQ